MQRLGGTQLFNSQYKVVMLAAHFHGYQLGQQPKRCHDGFFGKLVAVGVLFVCLFV